MELTFNDVMNTIDNDHYRLTPKERLAVKNADKIADLNWFIDEIARNSADAEMWNFKTMELNFTPDGKFDFKICQPQFGTPKPTFIATKRVIFNPPATIVFWNDGTKTVVKTHDELFDWEKGLAMAICKKYLSGNKGRYYNIFREYEKAGIEAEYKCGARIF